MSFRSLMIHRCTIIMPGQVVGKDDYNRDIIEDVPVFDVKCRSTQNKRRVSRDQYGVDYITEDVLFLLPSENIEKGMKIKDVVDKHNKPVLQGTYTIEEHKPLYGKVRLHHYELVLKKEGGSSG